MHAWRVESARRTRHGKYLLSPEPVTISDCSPLYSQEGLKMIHPPSTHPVPLDPNSGADSELIEKLHATLGDFFAERIASDAEWARGILSDENPVL